MDSCAFIETRKIYSLAEQVLRGRTGVMSLSCMKTAGFWGSPWGGTSRFMDIQHSRLRIFWEITPQGLKLGEMVQETKKAKRKEG